MTIEGYTCAKCKRWYHDWRELCPNCGARMPSDNRAPPSQASRTPDTPPPMRLPRADQSPPAQRTYQAPPTRTYQSPPIPAPRDHQSPSAPRTNEWPPATSTPSTSRAPAGARGRVRSLASQAIGLAIFIAIIAAQVFGRGGHSTPSHATPVPGVVIQATGTATSIAPTPTASH